MVKGASDTPRQNGRLFARWLAPLVDRIDWGYFDQRRRRPVRLMTADEFGQVIRRERFPRQRLGPKLVTSHLAGIDRLHVVPFWASGRWFGVIDVDAHHGERDAPAAAAFVAERFFPGAYAEPSPRGQHVYLVADTSGASGRRWNERVSRMGKVLRATLAEEGFAATVEVKGTFTVRTAGRTVERMGTMFPLPTLPRGRHDLDRLLCGPVFPSSTIDDVSDACDELADGALTEDTAEPATHILRRNGRTVGPGCGDGRASEDAWERMVEACWSYTVRHRALPAVSELLEWYLSLHPAAGPTTSGRRRRAWYAIGYRARTFDPNKVARGWMFAAERDRLLSAVREHCANRVSAGYTRGIEDLDLAVVLYAVTVGSFTVAEHPARQWSCPNASLAGMFNTLRSAGEIDLYGGDRHKLIAIKQILERSGLIECLDRRYVPSGAQRGIGKKYTIGPRHPRYGEFVRFADDIDVVWVREGARR